MPLGHELQVSRLSGFMSDCGMSGRFYGGVFFCSGVAHSLLANHDWARRHSSKNPGLAGRGFE